MTLVHNRTRSAACIGAVLALALAVSLCFVLPGVASAAEAPTDSSGAALASTEFSASRSDDVTVSEDSDEGLLEGCTFGIAEFTRYNKGTNRSTDGTYHGYRWPMASAGAFAVIPTEQGILVYIPAALLDDYGIDADDDASVREFMETLAAVDRASSDGGRVFADEGSTTVFVTSSDTVVWGAYTYRFGVEIEDGHWYATSTLEGSEDGSGGGLYALTGTLVKASGMDIATAPTGLAWLARFFSTLDWSPLWVSLRTTIVATLIIFIIGLLAAWGTIKVSNRLKGIFDTVFTIPMVLPPTVCGFLLLLFFGTSTSIGRFLIAHGIDIVFTWPAAVIACVVVGFPLMYRTARGAFENLEPTMLDAARTLGWSEPRIFRKLMLPLAWPSIAAGTVLAFARAMGEFGATLFFAGNFAGITQTMPLAIYFDWMGGKTETAIFWVIVVIIFSFLVILFINVYTSHVQKYRTTGGRRKYAQDEQETVAETTFTIDTDAAKRLGFDDTVKRVAGNEREGES